MISAGLLTEVVRLQDFAYTRNDSGEQVQGYSEIATIRANVKYNKGSRALAQGEVWMPTTIVVTCRYAKAWLSCRRLCWQDKWYLCDSVNGDRVSGTITITATLEDR